MTEHMAARIVLVALFATALISAVAFFVRGEKLLREVRARYPSEWQGAGRPTFLSLAIWGDDYWRPVRASNYFTFKSYASLGDGALTDRGASVRRLQFVMYGALAAVFIVGMVIGRLEAR